MAASAEELRQELENNSYLDADDADRTRAHALHGAGHGGNRRCYSTC